MANPKDAMANFVLQFDEDVVPTETDQQTAKGIDPRRYADAKPLRLALNEVAALFRSILSKPEIRAELNSLPELFQTRIVSAVAELEQMFVEMNGSWQQVVAGVVPPQWSPQKYAEDALRVHKIIAELYPILHPLQQADSQDLQRQQQQLKDLIAAAEDTKQKLEQAEKTAAVAVLAREQLDELGPVIKSHQRSAAIWLLFAVLAALFAARVVFWVTVPSHVLFDTSFPELPINPGPWQLLAHFTRKILLLSAVLAPVFISLRIYYSHVHNVIMNRQRQITMRAFPRLWGSLGESDTNARAELVRHASQTIFGQGSTGFLDKEHLDSKALELAAVLAGAAKK